MKKLAAVIFISVHWLFKLAVALLSVIWNAITFVIDIIDAPPVNTVGDKGSEFGYHHNTVSGEIDPIKRPDGIYDSDRFTTPSDKGRRI